MIITRRQSLAGLAGGALLGTLGAPAIVRAQKKPQVGIVVKIGGIPWFNAMEVGIKKDAAERRRRRLDDRADPAPIAALQVRAMEDLIAKKVDVIGVVPNDAKALEPVLQARPGRRHQGR